MSKEFKNIDELFKSTIGMGSAKAPTSVRNNVLSKTSGGGNFWLVGSGLLLVTVIGAVLTTVNMSKKTDLAAYQKRTDFENTIINTYQSQIQETAFTQNNEQISNTSIKHIIDTSPEYKRRSDYKISAKEIDKKLHQPFQKLERKENQKPILEQAIAKTEIIEPIDEANKVTVQVEDEVKKEVAETKNHKEVVISEDKTRTETNAVKESVISAVSKTANYNEYQNEVNSKLTNSNTSSSNLNKEATAPDNQSLSKTENSEILDTSFVSFKKDETIDSSKTDTKIEIETGKPEGQWMIGLKGGPNINNANYTNPEFTQPLYKLHDEKLGFFGQIYGQYLSSNGLTAAIGVGIEQQSYNTTFLTADTTYSIDSTLETTLKDYYGITSSQYLQLPFHFGCQIERNKWIYGVDLGIQINYLLKSSGTYFLNNNVLPIENSGIFKQTTFVYSVGGNLKYNLFNSVYLSANMRYIPSFQNYYESTYAKRSVSTFSIGFGLAYRF